MNYGQVYKKNTTLAYSGNKVSSVSGVQCLLPTSVHCDTHCFQNIGTAMEQRTLKNVNDCFKVLIYI